MYERIRRWLLGVALLVLCGAAALFGRSYLVGTATSETPQPTGQAHLATSSELTEAELRELFEQTANAGRTPCDPPVEQIRFDGPPDAAVSEQLAVLYQQDQAARTDAIDPPKLVQEDRQRRVQVMSYLRSGKIVAPDDLYYAAMIFQHGNCSQDYQLANTLAERAMQQGHAGARWLYAATLDRYLMNQGQFQKYGTQYWWWKGAFILYPVDPATTDEERLRYNVPPLVEAQAQAAEMSRNFKPPSPTP